jgi:hypothetical protein
MEKDIVERLRSRAAWLTFDGIKEYEETPSTDKLLLEAAAVIEYHRSKDCAVLLEIKKLEEDSIKLEAMIREFIGMLKDENKLD